MNLYEFEGKQLFAKHGIATPRGVVVRRGEDVKKAYEDLDVKDVVVKGKYCPASAAKIMGLSFVHRPMKWKVLFVKCLIHRFVDST
jgi:succinyl-CoA synthetase beta subunit